MEIGEPNKLEQNIQDSESDLDSPPIKMTVVLNDSNPYWANDAALRCASNATGGKVRRDFKFQVIQVCATGPKYFVWPTTNKTKEEHNEPTHKQNANTDQENQNVRRSMRTFMSRRKVSNEFNKKNNFVAMEDELCKVTATNQSSVAPMSEPTTRRINTKAIANMPIDCRFQVSKASLSVSPPSSSSECSAFSNQSTLSSCNSDTFRILSVAKKWEEDEDEEVVEQTNTDLPTEPTSPNSLDKPLILISSASDEK